MKLAVKDGGKTEYLLFLGQREVSGIADVIHERWDALSVAEAQPSEGKKAGKAKKQAAEGIDPEIERRWKKSSTAARRWMWPCLAGCLPTCPKRTSTPPVRLPTLSTHAVEREFDFYTAVDDLKPEDTAGADMMGTVEFNSACFYRYAVVDWAKLGETCNKIPNWRQKACAPSSKVSWWPSPPANRTLLPPTIRRNSCWQRCAEIRLRAIWPMP